MYLSSTRKCTAAEVSGRTIRSGPPALSAQTQFITTRQQRLQANRCIGAPHVLLRNTRSAGCAALLRVRNVHNLAVIEPLRSAPSRSSRSSPRSYADRILRGPLTHDRTICTTFCMPRLQRRSPVFPFRHDSLFGSQVAASSHAKEGFQHRTP